MDRRAKAALNRDKAARLNKAWDVRAAQARYSDDGHWYAVLERFPAALFDAHGYLFFEAEADYLTSPYLRLGKQINVRKPGISGVPGYVRVVELKEIPEFDVDIHTVEAEEGRRRLIQHLRRERNRTLVKNKKKLASCLDCEICGFSFSRAYGSAIGDHCEVHHLVPLGEAEEITRTRVEDLAILCANCHRVIHLRNPPYSLAEVRSMLGFAPDPEHQPLCTAPSGTG